MKLGNNDVQYVYLGSNQVRKVFLGTDEVWTPKPFEFTINTANLSAGSTTNTQFKLPLTTSTGLDCLVEWGDGSSDVITSHTAPAVTHTYPSSGTYSVKITGRLLGWQFAGGGDRLKMLNVSQWAGLNISVNNGFNGCTNLTANATDAPIITSTDLTNYFRFCTNFNGAIGNWNVGTVTTMFIMFADATSFNQPIGNWNVSNVTNMRAMFENAPSFNQNIGAWNVSKVTNFENIFLNATAFNNDGSDDIDDWTFSTTSNISMQLMFGGTNTTLSCKFNRYIGSWNTERVNTMNSMFGFNTAFNQNINTKTINAGLPNEYVAWDTSNVTNMASMFNSASAFNQDIGAWDVSNVSSFDNMFNDATAFNNGGLDSIKNWSIKTSSSVSMSNMFRGSNTTLSTKFNQPIGNWNTSAVNNMAFMFSYNTAFNQTIGNWNTSQVATMAGMFRGTLFAQDINTKVVNIGLPNEYIAWNTSNVTSMVEMFNGASAFNQNIGAWDVSKVTSFASMFNNATVFNNNGSDDIDNWTFSTTSNIDMSAMFGGSSTTLSCKFNRYIGSWDTQRVTNMSFMFYQNTAFNQDIGTWNTGNVLDMFYMFAFNSAFNKNIGSWNVSNVFRFERMFWGATTFNNDGSDSIKNWVINTSTAVNMRTMFQDARDFNQPIGSWNVSSVTNMQEMFRASTITTAFNQDISDWNVSNVANFLDFMGGKTAATYLAQYLSNIYEKWSLLTLVPNLSISFGTIKYNTSGAIGKNRLLNAPKNWVIADGGQEAPFAFSVKTDNAGVSTSTQFRMPLTTSTNLGFTVNWGDGVTETITDHTLAIHTYASAGTYNVSVTGAILGWQFAGGGDRLKMLDVSQWAGLNISTNRGFDGCTNLTATANDAPIITTSVLLSTFRSCINFNGAVNTWDMSNVQSLNRFFNGCTNFNQPLSSWDVSNVTDMARIFQSCTNFNQPLSSWDVSNVTDFTIIFNNATAFNQDIGSWIVDNVTNMQSMFQGATAFNQDIGNWNVSNVTNFIGFMAGKTAANYSAANLNSIYNGWSSLPSVRPNINISFGSIAYTSTSQAGKNILTSAPNNWVITDGGAAFQYTADVSSAGTSGVGFFQLPLVNDGNSINSIVDWGDGTTSEVTAFNDVDTLHNYNTTSGAAGTKTITISGLFSGWQFNNGGDRLKMRNVSSWGALKISVGSGFYGCSSLTASATDAPVITSTSLQRYFSICGQFNGEIGNWDVSSVTDMSFMFLNFGGLFNRNIGAWNVSNVTNFVQMFEFGVFNNGGSDSIKDWDVSKGTDFAAMFGSCPFNQPIQSWVFSTISNISLRLMFTNNTAFNQPIGAWDTSRVTSMAGVLYNNLSFDQDLSNWDINQVTVFNDSAPRTFFGNGTLSTANYDALLISWEAQAPLLNKSIDFGLSEYTLASAAATARANLISIYNWTITDGGGI
jgi:surface protein